MLAVWYLLALSERFECPYFDSETVLGYNADLHQRLATLEGNIVETDIHGLMNEINTDPEAYGFDEVSVFTDGLHLSDPANQILASYIQSIFEAPQIISILPSVGLSIIQNHNASMALQFPSALEEGKYAFYANVNNASTDIDASANSESANADTMGVLFGVNYGVNPLWAVGCGLGLNTHEGDFGGNRGDYSMGSYLFSLYTTFSPDRFDINFMLTRGTLNYDEINRTVTLGDVERTVTGDTSGASFGGRVSVAYDLVPAEDIKLSPFVGLDFEKFTVDGYSEDGDYSTSMHYADMDRDSQAMLFGALFEYNAQTALGMMKYFFKGTYHSDSKDDLQTMEAGVNAFEDSTFSIDGYQPESKYTLLTIGLNAALSEKVSAHFSYSLRNGDASKGHFLSAGVKV